MKQNDVTPVPPTLRFVAVCDVLGFKHMLDTTELPTIVQRYQRLATVVQQSIDSITFTLKPDAGELMDFAVFSDTCFVWRVSYRRRIGQGPPMHFGFSKGLQSHHRFWNPFRNAIASRRCIWRRVH
jgi:hypothetical protein